jgi:SAM-dependent methyltransferase
LTPDAGSPVSKLLGPRWPEVRRVGEHAVLYSTEGIAQLAARAGFVACGWHPIGKVASLATLAADVESVAPRLLGPARKWIAVHGIGRRTFEFDPRTKFCLYARRLPDRKRHPGHRPVRIPKRPESLESVENAILEELGSLAAARRYCDWMFEQFSTLVSGHVVEVGAGIGTFSQRILDHGAQSLLAIEPDPLCAGALEQRFAEDRRVQLSRDFLPEAPDLRASPGEFDLAVCQNVLEHIGDDVSALRAMRRALRPGGHLALVVPANPRLFGALDEAYGHWRRYDQESLSAAVVAAGFDVPSIRPINVLGVFGWWAKNRRPAARIGSGSFAAYEAILPLWRRIEKALPRRWGLSLVCIAQAPTTASDED